MQFAPGLHVGSKLVKSWLHACGCGPLAAPEAALGNELPRLSRVGLILNAAITPSDDAIQRSPFFRVSWSWANTRGYRDPVRLRHLSLEPVSHGVGGCL